MLKYSKFPKGCDHVIFPTNLAQQVNSAKFIDNQLTKIKT